MCKCRDTGSKRCRWEHKSDNDEVLQRVLHRLERKRIKVQLRLTYR